MARLIYLDEAIKQINRDYDSLYWNVDKAHHAAGVELAISAIESLDTVEAEPVKHGKWEFGRQRGVAGYWCTNCKSGFTGENAEWIAKEHDFCPKCGADMRGDQE